LHEDVYIPVYVALFLAGNSTLTIPYMFSKHKDSGFPFGCTDTSAADGRRGSNRDPHEHGFGVTDS
jgi:hypothetical protein